MDSNVDLIVIGTGSAAGSVAYKCRSAGWSVTVVDSRPFGGTCQLRGCDPKKVLVGGAELVDWNRRMHGNGVPAAGVSIDWPDLMRFKRTFTDEVPQQNETSLAEAGVGIVHGRCALRRSHDPASGSDLFQQYCSPAQWRVRSARSPSRLRAWRVATSINR